MICILHVLGRGGILYNLSEYSLKYNLVWFLEIICYISVNCYAIITGYLMINTKFKYKKIIDLWINVLFWSFFLTLGTKILFPDIVSKEMLFESLFPVTFSKYWYFTAYFGLFLFIPFINKLIDVMDKNMFKRLIVTTILLFSFINVFTDSFKLDYGYSFLWLVSCYFIGAYTKRFELFKNFKIGTLFIFSFLFLIITFLSKLFIPKINCSFINEDMLICYNSFTILFSSICFVIAFLKMKINNKYFKRFIKRMAPATFGVYIIHVHPNVWDLFMKNRFLFVIFSNPLKMMLLVFLLAFILYALCSYLEMFRIYLFKKLRINKISEYIYNILSKMFKKINFYFVIKVE